MNHQPLVLISGGSKGLGLEIVKRLLQAGYRVVTFSRKSTSEVETLSQTYPQSFWFFEGDMSQVEALEPQIKRIEKDLGPIEILINNAGIARDGVLPIQSVEDIETVIHVNLVGVLKLTRLVSRLMIVRKRGCIINISSIVGLRGYRGLAAYSASKAGLDGMTRALAREFGEKNIRVNSIAPGYLITEMTGTMDEEHKQQIIRRTPLGRLGTPQDVAGAVLFLISPDAAFITGHTLVIDGGVTC
ncbi:MAG: 3-oxoacyl-ACP reductase FabG [bacterium]|nr:3-oxoacyl-ACP reductase FabG [bacterium]